VQVAALAIDPSDRTIYAGTYGRASSTFDNKRAPIRGEAKTQRGAGDSSRALREIQRTSRRTRRRRGETLSGSVRPGERGWVKIKNREYWRYEMEREGAITAAKRRRRAFV
jgi:hypothetical protein